MSTVVADEISDLSVAEAIGYNHCRVLLEDEERNVQEVVGMAASLLDNERPGWAAEIDLDRLNIASFESCVLGQLTGDFTYEYRALERKYGVKHPALATFGNGRYPNERLNDAWRGAILARR